MKISNTRDTIMLVCLRVVLLFFYVLDVIGVVQINKLATELGEVKGKAIIVQDILKLGAGKLDQMFGHQYPVNQTFHSQQQLELASQQLSQTVGQGVQVQQEAAAHKQSINSSSSSKSSTAPAAAAHHQKKQNGKGKERGWQRVLIAFVI